MSISYVAFRDLDAYDGGRPRKAIPQNIIAGVCLALITLSCGWTLQTHLFAVPVEAGATPAGDAAIASVPAAAAQASFAERFGAVALAAAAPQRDLNTASLLDPNFSLGFVSGPFRSRAALEADYQAMTVAALPDAAQDGVPLPVVRQIAQNIPLPPSRPSELRLPQSKSGYGHDMLVQRARAALLAASKPRDFSIFDKLFGDPPPARTVLAYAGPDGGILGDGSDSAASRPGVYDRSTAVYDISARTVYMPDGSKLEAHSGLGQHLDNPAYAHLRMRGVTPPHIYDLKPREALFHGVAALRLTPVGGESAIFGRTGLLAHTYMLGPNGDSNGCVSFKDYNAFLRAHRNGDVKRLIVVAKL